MNSLTGERGDVKAQMLMEIVTIQECKKPSYCTQPFPAETTAVNYSAAFTLHTADTDLAKNESKASNKISE